MQGLFLKIRSRLQFGIKEDLSTLLTIGLPSSVSDVNGELISSLSTTFVPFSCASLFLFCNSLRAFSLLYSILALAAFEVASKDLKYMQHGIYHVREAHDKYSRNAHQKLIHMFTW